MTMITIIAVCLIGAGLILQTISFSILKYLHHDQRQAKGRIDQTVHVTQ